MKTWIGPLSGALIVGTYGMLKLGEQWNVGGEHAFRASGTLLAYMLLGAFIGLIIAGLFFSATHNEIPGSDSLSEETKHARDQALLSRVSPRLLGKAAPAGRGCPMSHRLPDKTKVRDRLQRIRMQIESLQRALDAGLGVVDILGMLSDARSGINSLSAELVEDYIRRHVDRAPDGDAEQAQAVQGLVDAMRSYLAR